MPKSRVAAVALTAVVLSVVSATPAQAANSPQVRSTGETTTFQYELATLDVRYRCAPGLWVNLDAELWQGGTADDPASLYVGPTGNYRPICDGKKHTVELELRIPDWDWDYGSANYLFLTPKSEGGARAHVTVTMSDHLGNVMDVDHDRVAVLAR